MFPFKRFFFVFFGFLFFGFTNVSIAQEESFHRIGVEHGISHSVINSIQKDKYGFMWFATGNGLCKFDGKSTKVYLPSRKNTRIGLKDYNIVNIKLCNNGDLMLSSFSKIYRYSYSNDAFIDLTDSDEFKKKLSNHVYNKIEVLSDSVLCITVLNKAFTYNFYTHHIDSVLNQKPGEEVQQITNFCKSLEKGFYFVARYQSIYKVNPITKEESLFYKIENNSKIGSYEVGNPEIFGDSLYLSVRNVGVAILNLKTKVIDRIIDLSNYNYNIANSFHVFNSNLWIGTSDNGIFKVSLNNDSIYNFVYEKSNLNSIPSNQIICSYFDPNGVLWYGSGDGGVFYLDLKEKVFHKRFHVEGKANTLPFKSVIGIFEDSKQRIWLGSWVEGFAVFNRRNNTFEHVKPYGPNQEGMEWHSALCRFVELKSGDILGLNWINGLWRIKKMPIKSKVKWKISKVYDELNVTNKSLNWSGRDMWYKKETDELWIVTNDSKLTKLNFKTKEVSGVQKVNDTSEIPRRNYAWCTIEDNSHNLYIGSNFFGLFIYNYQKNTLKRYSGDKYHIHGFPASHVKCAYIDNKGKVWMGTGGEGLISLDTATKKFTQFTTDEGLSNNVIYSILEDDNNNLWISTDHGLSKFNKSTGIFTNYFISDGLLDNEYGFNSGCKAKDGTLFFGGKNGFIFFNPESIKKDSTIMPLVITNFSIFNKSVNIGDTILGYIPLSKNINETKEIRLSYKHSLFTIDFAALHFREHDKIKYEYMLDGLDNSDWIETDIEHSKATFTNLSGGTYKFKLRAYNPDGILTPEKTLLVIYIDPPFWKTWWFILCAILISIISIVLFFRARTKYLVKRKKMLELQVAERTEDLQKKTMEVQLANEELVAQSEEIQQNLEQIAQQNIHITHLYTEQTDNIQVSQRIQQSILPLRKNIESNVGSILLYYKPKDIVSGDFYWFYETDTYNYVAIVDCTGHGVSGAFMTLMAYNLLNQVLLQLQNPTPAEILNQLTILLIDALKQKTDDAITKDGMDASLIRISKNKGKVLYAGAGLKTYHIRNGELTQIEGNKYAVGILPNQRMPLFEDKEIDIAKGDLLYLFSDGIPGQFGGKSGDEKLKYGQFRSYIETICKYPINEQESLIEKLISDWKGEFDQTDDMILMGIQF
ncbi:MAG: two-component regulator propeller domain-containing protein [Bacteroidota bacterium]|nr:two-component regulator propeller domain-containing protein [Bacteroidota bacterium]